MNGATTDPWAKIRSPPSTTRPRMIGRSQSFLRALRKAHSSFRKDMVAFLELLLERIGWRSRRLAVDPVRRGVRVVATLERIAAHEAHDECDRNEHEREHHEEHDGAHHGVQCHDSPET